MKNRNIFLALVMSVGLFATSCSSDDNEGETLAPLAGKWNITQVDIIDDGQEILVDAPQNQSGCDKDYLNLKLDNTAELGNYDSTITDCALTVVEGIYSRSHNDLTVVINGVTSTSDIVNLSLKELKLKDKTTGVISVYERN